MSGPVVLGIDVGSSSVKVLALDERGEVLDVRRRPYPVRTAPGVVEGDAELWWAETASCVRALAVDLGRVAAVGLSGHMSSVVLVDANGAPLRPAVLLADGRGEGRLRALAPATRAAIGASSQNPVTRAAASVATLLWLAEEEPELLAGAAAVLSAKDFVRLRLTGALGTEPTDAHNTGVLALGPPGWRWDLIGLLGLPAHLFPPVGAAEAVAGGVGATAAAATGLPEGVPVVHGLGDMAAACVGAGATRPGMAVVSLGTSVTALGAIGSRDLSAGQAGRLTLHPLPGGERYALASLLTGGLALDWLRRLCGAPVADAPAALDADDPLVFVPQLSGTGTPDFEPAMRGALLGLTPATTAGDLAAALFEAIAFELRSVLALLEVDPEAPLRVTGGGARLPGWVAALADATQREVEVLAEPEVSALGAALLAHGLGGAGPTPPPAVARRVAPDPARAANLARRGERYARARALALEFHRGAAPAGLAPSPIAGAPA